MDTESLPSSLLWSSHWSLACLCHLSVSLRRRAKTSYHLTLSFLISAPLLSLGGRGWRKTNQFYLFLLLL
ncbi:hypothetical protein PBY51_015347 [Eleginops maclovinus]|uniref:Uncharacterized protein n=1 Tax=Eleginops maclovinus TaxID=56733 RepID=A0AAN8AGL6_ELEMC|nr:hypothetical protein PBY51_015347 [Eleginops maclovinus]